MITIVSRDQARRTFRGRRLRAQIALTVSSPAMATIVAIALAERRWNVIDRQGIDDYILELIRGGLAQT